MAPFTCLTEDGVLIAGDIFNAHGRVRGRVVLAHGLPSTTPPPADVADDGYPGLARRIAAVGFDVVIFNYRGTGMSGGHLEIDLWPLDLAAVLNHLDNSGWRGSQYAVVGFSAGAAAAIVRSMSDDRINPLITMAAPADFNFLPVNTDPQAWFALYQEMGMIRQNYQGTAEEWAARFQNLVPREAIGRSRAEQIYIIHGTADDVVPVTHATILTREAGRKAQQILIAGGIHQMRRDARAVEILLDLLQRGHP